jgi:hypothetical protein
MGISEPANLDTCCQGSASARLSPNFAGLSPKYDSEERARAALATLLGL